MWLHCGVAQCGVAAALWFLLLAVGFYTSHSALGEGETGGMAVLAFPGWTTREGVPRLRLVSVLSPHLRLVSVSRIRGALWLCCQPPRAVGTNAVWPSSKNRPLLGRSVALRWWPPVGATSAGLLWPARIFNSHRCRDLTTGPLTLLKR